MICTICGRTLDYEAEGLNMMHAECKGFKTYLPSPAMGDQVNKAFLGHTLTAEQAIRNQRIKERFLELARFILSCTPPGRDQSLALTHLQTASMFTSTSICSEAGTQEKKL